VTARSAIAIAMLSVVGCGAASGVGSSLQTPGEPPTAEMLSRAAEAALCPLTLGKLYTLNATHGDARDAYVWVRECRAESRPPGLELRASAAVWMVVDRDVGPVHLEQFVQATLSIEVAYSVTAIYLHDHAEVSLRPVAPPRSDVEAVGALDPQPLNWAALAAENLVPALGTTSEWVAKTAARTEAQKALAAVLGQELRVGIDAQRDRLWVGAAGPPATMSSRTRQSVRVAAHGTALLGPFEGDMKLAVASVSGGMRISAEALCPEDLERIIARDRRAEAIDTTAWFPLESGSKRTVNAPRSCPWMLALRTRGAESVTVDLDAESAETLSREAQLKIALAVESVAIEPSLANADLDVWLVAGDERVRLQRPPKPAEPHVFVMPADGKLVVQTTLRGEPAVISEAALVPGGERKAVVKDHEGNPGTVTIRSRVFAAPQRALGGLRP
jgi:hypothetical protein